RHRGAIHRLDGRGREEPRAVAGCSATVAWGYNTSGQLGDGTVISRSTPVQAQGLTGVATISVGFSHTVASRTDGTVWTVGSNSHGELGDGTMTPRSTPVQVQGLGN
ncbi:hypothetical protein ACLESD_29065, partial [Pyxidicoccus sp. 3LFB2]